MQNGDTALHRAVSAGNDKVVQRLLDEACDVDRQNRVCYVHYVAAKRRFYFKLMW